MSYSMKLVLIENIYVKGEEIMEHVQFVLSILLALIILILLLKFWMNIANRIGEILGISKVINWIVMKLDSNHKT